MPTSPDDQLAAAAASDFARRLATRWQADLQDELLGIYLLGSLAHGGFSRRYSDIDIAVITESGLAPATLDALKAAATGVSGELGPKVSIFWTDRRFGVGRFPPLDRADYLDHAVTLYERERVAPARPMLDEVRAYLTGAPLASWVKAAGAFAASDALDPKDRKSYLRALLYPARFMMSFMTGKMASNDDAVARLSDWALPGLDLELIRRALACRHAAGDPDPLFPSRTLLPRQVAAITSFVAESEAEQPLNPLGASQAHTAGRGTLYRSFGRPNMPSPKVGRRKMSNVMADAAPAERRIDPCVSRRGFLASAAAAGAAGAFPASGSAQQGPGSGTAARSLKVLSAGSALYGMRPCAEAFTRRTSIAVAVATDHGHNIRKAALEGRADADVVLVPTSGPRRSSPRATPSARPWSRSARCGSAPPCARARRARTYRPWTPAPLARRRRFRAAHAGPTGDHLLKVIERIGLADTVKGKLKRFDTATLLNKHLAETAGPGALGFGPATEIMVWRGKGVTWAGAVPDEIQIVLPYSGAMLTRTQAKEDARALLAFIATPEARKHFLDSGVE